MSPFLPEGYRTPEPKGGKYFKPKEGESRVRILDSPILGYEGWTVPNHQHKNGQPVRRKLDDFPEGSIDSKKGSKHFWAVPCWNYATNSVQVWEITQNTIQTAIEGLVYSKDWGDPKRYDLIIQREGKGLDTTYQVMPAPPKPAAQEIRDAWTALRSNGFDLNRLFSNGDPFEAGASAPADVSPDAWDEVNPPPATEEEIPF